MDINTHLINNMIHQGVSCVSNVLQNNIENYIYNIYVQKYVFHIFFILFYKKFTKFIEKQKILTIKNMMKI